MILDYSKRASISLNITVKIWRLHVAIVVWARSDWRLWKWPKDCLRDKHEFKKSHSHFLSEGIWFMKKETHLRNSVALEVRYFTRINWYVNIYLMWSSVLSHKDKNVTFLLKIYFMLAVFALLVTKTLTLLVSSTILKGSRVFFLLHLYRL